MDLLRGYVRFGSRTADRVRDGWVDETLGPVRITSAPAVVADGSGTSVFARGENGNLIALRRACGDRSWSGPMDLGLPAFSAPTAVSLGKEGDWIVFYTGQDGYLNCAVHGSAPGWHRQFSLAGLVPGLEPMSEGADPAAVSFESGTPGTRDLMVFYRGGGGALEVVKQVSGHWSLTRRPEVILKDTPTAVVRGDGSVRVFFRGLNDRLWVTGTREQASPWSAPEDMGLNFLAGPPSVVWSESLHEMAVYYRGTNGTLWFTHWPNQPGDIWWSAAYDTTRPAACVGAATAWGPEVYFSGPDARIHSLHPPRTWLAPMRAALATRWPCAREKLGIHLWPTRSPHR